MSKWKIIILITGVTTFIINFSFGILFPKGWRLSECPPLTCDVIEPFGYEPNILYGIINFFTISLIIFIATLFLANSISRVYYKSRNVNLKPKDLSRPIIIFVFTVVTVASLIILYLHFWEASWFLEPASLPIEKYVEDL